MVRGCSRPAQSTAPPGHFTADWCPTCQVHSNHHQLNSVRKKPREITHYLVADFSNQTNHQQVVWKNSAGPAVPLCMVYPQNAEKPPSVLPDCYPHSEDCSSDALDKALALRRIFSRRHAIGIPCRTTSNSRIALVSFQQKITQTMTEG